MKNKRGNIANIVIVILAAAIIAVGAVYIFSVMKKPASQPASQPVKTQPVSVVANNTDASKLEKSPEQVVQEYYESMISFLNRENSVDNKLNPDFVTQKIINAYQGSANIPASPFLCAQDYPDDASKLSVSLVNKDEASASCKVIVFTNWPPISVSLVNEGGKWKINEIVCANGNKL